MIMTTARIARRATGGLLAGTMAACSGSGHPAVRDPNALARTEVTAVTQDIRATMHAVPDAATLGAKVRQWGPELHKAYNDAHGDLKAKIAKLGEAIVATDVAYGLGMADRSTVVGLGNAVRAVEAAAR
jgi:hypothetical protein